MRFAQLLDAELRDVHRDDPARYAPLAALLVQETQLRVLHVTDFFVEGREDLLLELGDHRRPGQAHHRRGRFHDR